jgi:hypothetical protein
MANDSVNLKYTSYSKFFSNVKALRQEININKSRKPVSKFSEKDEIEIGRGASYALFPELLDDISKDRQVTVKSFKQALSDRGVTDIDYQNKILFLILQNKAGIQYYMGDLVNSLLLENQYQLLMSNYDLELKVNSSNEVTLIFKAIWNDITQDPRVPAIEANIEVSITPGNAKIANFNLTKIGDTEQANNGFKFLQDNQQNILGKLITYIMDVFGFDTGRTLESKEDDSEESSLSP